MRIRERLNHITCFLLILIAAAGVDAFAQGRGRGAVGATNGFYRFDYTKEERRPSTTGGSDRHPAPDHVAQ